MAQSHREASRRLFDLAEQQQGFFTTKQAKAAGFAENTLRRYGRVIHLYSPEVLQVRNSI
jgi:hypothetical protein